MPVVGWGRVRLEERGVRAPGPVRFGDGRDQQQGQEASGEGECGVAGHRDHQAGQSRRQRVGVRGQRSGGRRDDVADLGVGAVGGIESVAATDEALELCFQGRELALAGLDLVQLGGEQVVDVGAGCGPLTA